MTADFGQGA